MSPVELVSAVTAILCQLVELLVDLLKRLALLFLGRFNHRQAIRKFERLMVVRLLEGFNSGIMIVEPDAVTDDFPKQAGNQHDEGPDAEDNRPNRVECLNVLQLFARPLLDQLVRCLEVHRVIGIEACAPIEPLA